MGKGTFSQYLQPDTAKEFIVFPLSSQIILTELRRCTEMTRENLSFPKYYYQKYVLMKMLKAFRLTTGKFCTQLGLAMITKDG